MIRVRVKLVLLKPILVFFLLLNMQVQAQDKKGVLLFEDFNNIAPNSLGKKLIKNKHIDLVGDKGADGSAVIRVAYVGYEKGSQRVTLRFPLKRRVTHATLSFDVLFDRDFQWTKGGKLHGLGPESPVGGGKKRSPKKWSARTMFKQEGYVSTYLYDQNEHEKYGIGVTSASPAFTKNKWHHMELEVKLNTLNETDGFARVSIDGDEQSLSDNVVFRGEDGAQTEIQTFIFSTFHGGNSAKWTPVDELGSPITVYAYYDNFKVIDNVESRVGID